MSNGFLDDLFGGLFGNNEPPPKHTSVHLNEGKHCYEVQLKGVRGTFTIPTDTHHEDDNWPHHMAVKLRSFMSDEDAATFRNHGGIIQSVIGVGGMIYGVTSGRRREAVLLAKIEKMEEALMQLLRRHHP